MADTPVRAKINRANTHQHNQGAALTVADHGHSPNVAYNNETRKNMHGIADGATGKVTNTSDGADCSVTHTPTRHPTNAARQRLRSQRATW